MSFGILPGAAVEARSDESQLTTPRPGLLFHFTHLDHLGSILDAGRIMSDSAVQTSGVTLSAEAGDPEIKERRRRCAVPCGPGGYVADYVPFYFAARSPMMYKIAMGGVPSFEGDYRKLVYLLSDVSSVQELNLPCVVTDRNAAVAIADFSDNLSVLGDLEAGNPESEFVDWVLMRQQIWKNTPGEPDRMERRMAELLVHHHFPLSGLVGAAVQNQQLRSNIEQMFEQASLDAPVRVRAGWYY